MAPTYWHRQTAQSPLFEDLLWSRPENKTHAGKLLIVGGNLHGFSAPAAAYKDALGAGIGECRILLPDALKKTVGKILDVGEYGPSTPSGSFAKIGLAETLEQAQWADGVLLAGDFGRNSETAILIESFLQKYSGQVSLVQDSVEYITSSHPQLPTRLNTCLVLTMAQLQRLFTAYKWPKAIRLEMPQLQLTELLHEFSLKHNLNIIVKQLDTIHVVVGGEVSSTPADASLEDNWRIKTAAFACTWWLQNPSQTFEALTTSLIAG